MTSLLVFLAILTFTPDLTKEDVKKLAASGMSDDVIVLFVRKYGPITPALSADDLVELRKAKVSQKVLAALVAFSRNPPASPTGPSSPPESALPPGTYVDPGYDPYADDSYGYPFYDGVYGWTYWPWTRYPYYYGGRPWVWYHHHHGYPPNRPSPYSTRPHGIQPHGPSAPPSAPRGHR